MALSGLGLGDRAWFVGATPKGLLTQAEFYQATWDWVQDTGAATTTWGSIKDWDVSGVLSFYLAFSTSRNELGSFQSSSKPQNVKAAVFSGLGLDKWKTTAVTSLRSTFSGAAAMTPDLASWDVSRVTSLQGTFALASSMNTDFSSCTYGCRGGDRRERLNTQRRAGACVTADDMLLTYHPPPTLPPPPPPSSDDILKPLRPLSPLPFFSPSAPRPLI